MVAETTQTGVNTSLTPEQQADIHNRTDRTLLEIIRDNFNTQYASQSASLARFRDAVSDTYEDDDTLLAHFRTHVPLSTYAPYKPFADKFNARPCREKDVENMFAPGLPDFLALSSATSGAAPKLIPKYNYRARLNLPPRPMFDPNGGPLAVILCTAYKEIKDIERDPGEVVHRIPVCVSSAGGTRRGYGWYTDDDESRMFQSMRGQIVPWAATVIEHIPSLITIHGLFFLACRDVKEICIMFAPAFIDLMRQIDEQWEVLISSIREGIVPDMEGIDHVRKYLQARLHADPERAAELRKIGPPFSIEGWVTRVWPKTAKLMMLCSGPFATVLPKVRSILGPSVPISCPVFVSSEATLGFSHDNKLDEFVLRSDAVVEFLDLSQDETHEHIRQAWEVEAGKHYEPVLTTRDGLWRYQLGDMLHIVGFDPKSNSPVFKFLGRKSLVLRLPHVDVRDYHLLEAVQAIQSESILPIQEFTTVIDDRTQPPCMGFFAELFGPPGPDAHLALQMLLDALSRDTAYQEGIEQGHVRPPTIRILKTSAFADHRQWRVKHFNVPSSQIKVPLVLFDSAQKEWFLERVVQEL